VPSKDVSYFTKTLQQPLKITLQTHSIFQSPMVVRPELKKKRGMTGIFTPYQSFKKMQIGVLH
jgi:hypothetical protein